MCTCTHIHAHIYIYAFLCIHQYVNEVARMEGINALTVQVSFAKEHYKRDDILQKRPIILRRLQIVATPYGVATASRID